MRSMRRGESTLLTCGGENGSQMASGDGAVRPDFNVDRSSFRWCSGSKNHLGGNGARGGPSPSEESTRGSPVKWFDGGGRQWRRRLGMGAKHTGRTSIYRGFCSLCSQGGLRLNPSLNGFKSTKFGENINWG
jgi:hypothetical protein